MGKFDIPIILGLGGVGAYFLLFTQQGKDLLAGIIPEASASEDFDMNKFFRKYAKSVSSDPGAFIPGSDRWYEIVKKNRGKSAANELREKALKNDLEAYFGSI